MSVKELAERGIAAFNAHDRAALRALCTEDCTFTSVGGVHAEGADACVEATAVWFDAFPDCRSTTTRLCVDGDTFIEEGIFEGNHKGTLKTPMGDIPATGRHVRGEYVNISTCRGDKVTTQTLYFDRMQLAEQLGIVPTATATA